MSSVHDGDIAPMITALDVINDEVHLPVTHVEEARKWRKSQVSPMGGRVILEVLACDGRSEAQAERSEDAVERKFIRLNINDGITLLPDCFSGPGSSCPLSQFVAHTKRKGEEVGDFKEVCGLDEDAEGRVGFLHQ